MTPGARRGLTAWRYRSLLAERGPEHPATQAAHGRMLAAWRSPEPLSYWGVAYVARRRALGDAGYNNRRTRRRLRRAFRAALRTIGPAHAPGSE